jgi:hypothetical protein
VFQRYLKQLEGRVTYMNGDPGKVYPSPTGVWQVPYRPGQPTHPQPGHPGHSHPTHERPGWEQTGKIAGLIFDRFGDFEGFVLDIEEGERKFFSREKEMEELAERAWRERLRITVCAERDEPQRPLTIIVREPPAPFWH